jgi:hypothetical protein
VFSETAPIMLTVTNENKMKMQKLALKEHHCSKTKLLLVQGNYKLENLCFIEDHDGQVLG